MWGSTQPTLKAWIWFNFHPFGALVHLMPNNFTTLTNYHIQGCFGQLFKQNMGFLEIFLHKDFGMMISTSSSLLTVAVHVVPTQFPNDVFIFALSSWKAKAHLEIRAAFINMPKMTVLTSYTSILNKILTNFQIMAKVASFSIRALSSTLKLITCFYFTFIMGVGAGLALTTFAVYEFLADSIGC